MQPLAVLAIEIILCAYFLRQTEAGLKMFGLVNLLLVITTGEAMANYGFGISNIGNIYYAFGLPVRTGRRYRGLR